MGRVRPVTKGCFRTVHGEGPLCGGEVGVASAMTRPVGDTHRPAFVATKQLLARVCSARLWASRREWSAATTPGSARAGAAAR